MSVPTLGKTAAVCVLDNEGWWPWNDHNPSLTILASGPDILGLNCCLSETWKVSDGSEKVFVFRAAVNFHGRDLVRAEARVRTRSVLSAVFQGLNEAQLWPLDGGQTEYIENAHLLQLHQHHQLKLEKAVWHTLCVRILKGWIFLIGKFNWRQTAVSDTGVAEVQPKCSVWDKSCTLWRHLKKIKAIFAATWTIWKYYRMLQAGMIRNTTYCIWICMDWKYG